MQKSGFLTSLLIYTQNCNAASSGWQTCHNHVTLIILFFFTEKEKPKVHKKTRNQCRVTAFLPHLALQCLHGTQAHFQGLPEVSISTSKCVWALWLKSWSWCTILQLLYKNFMHLAISSEIVALLDRTKDWFSHYRTCIIYVYIFTHLTEMHSSIHSFWKSSKGLAHMSRVMRKPVFCVCKNKGPDKLRG